MRGHAYAAAYLRRDLQAAPRNEGARLRAEPGCDGPSNVEMHSVSQKLMFGASGLLHRVLDVVSNPPSVAARPAVGARVVSNRTAFYLKRKHPQFGVCDDEIAFTVNLFAVRSDPKPGPRVENDEGIIQHSFQTSEHVALCRTSARTRDSGVASVAGGHLLMGRSGRWIPALPARFQSSYARRGAGSACATAR